MDGLEMATAERTDLVGLLATLTPEQWEAQSLCARWRVRDVVAHVIGFDGVSLLSLLGRVVRGRIVDANQVWVNELASLSTDELLERVQARLRPQGLATSFGGRLALLDVTVHHQDIRRPLDLPRQIPAERLRCVLGDSLRTPELPGWHLARGVRLTTTDLDWSHGKGPELTGPAEAVLMAVTGRHSVIGELTGPGQQVVARRLGRRQRRMDGARPR
ncbi:maleylpyruvate isomerase family mycothiol-dependent enzyme [Mycolicibacterium sp. ELW1]|uniref:maleylpyruvate isomerase family mycothiol-dependent enzyme n=1 Tax=Mycobacteriaceae TaxID=1762 RepID=UPI0011EE368A|nr:maleylpyruvate isomerase family mycothiol-dependent enzyme [Mycobacterium sp. ELW1]QEN14323.1 maleylpyruvate isomerase family mycothiol-dependent enzyme [Mycobacterium sp. ELW1]